MKNWDDETQRWIAVICRIELDDDGKERIVVYDVDCAETQVEIDDKIKASLKTRPWESSELPSAGE